ncbi:glycerophosphodiester phosphodiesterase [Chondromyces apiculatus]|uniref:Glycerophosphoryl diester phosphodiesterase n=1 Tax=Chondromyces apiculatus DSM 436 TaxID=1192034 RepID=A0A017SUR7_9BACT|nr:glycerophosphodiester phosphodiesterase [Chondromyces apiculatus]EYF00733.1 Glycerophosphoryl diester phosphodiesterase [Chondromyces apiculatus DSM 436]
MRYADGPRPRLFGHRGASGELPENTLPAFAAALEAGADRLELDVHRTADGEIVVFHDPTLDRTTSGRGLLAAHSLAELSRFDAGHHHVMPDGSMPHRGRDFRIPRLAEVLEAFPGVPVNIEIKPDDDRAIEGTLAVLDGAKARERTLLAAEQVALLQRIRAAAPEVLTGFAAEEVIAFMMAGNTPEYRAPGFALQVPPSFQGMPVVTAEFVARAHALGVEVHVWTINDAAEAEALLALGVDGIMSDFPGRIARLLGR